MNFPGYITQKQSERFEEQKEQTRFWSQVESTQNKRIESLNVLEKNLPLLSEKANSLALPIEIDKRFKFSKPTLVGGWIIGRFYNDNDSTSMISHISWVAITEDGKLVNGNLIKRQGQQILSVKKFQLSRSKVSVLVRKTKNSSVRSFVTLGGHAQQHILEQPDNLRLKLKHYLNTNKKTFGEIGW